MKRIAEVSDCYKEDQLSQHLLLSHQFTGILISGRQKEIEQIIVYFSGHFTSPDEFQQ